jgi:hypothetical protein
MFSSTVIGSNSEKCWNTMPMPSARAACGSMTCTVSPFHSSSPSSGLSTP